MEEQLLKTCSGCGGELTKNNYCPCPVGRKLYGRRKAIIRKAWKMYHEMGYAEAITFARQKAPFMGGYWYAIIHELNGIRSEQDPEGKIKSPPVTLEEPKNRELGYGEY